MNQTELKSKIELTKNYAGERKSPNEITFPEKQTQNVKQNQIKQNSQSNINTTHGSQQSRLKQNLALTALKNLH